MGATLQIQRGNRAHDASYFMRKQSIWKTTSAKWGNWLLGWKRGDKKSVSAGNLKLKEQYFTLENMNYPVVRKKKSIFCFPLLCKTVENNGTSLTCFLNTNYFSESCTEKQTVVTLLLGLYLSWQRT